MDTLTGAGSRAATDDLLAGLRTGGWRPGAWGRFLRRAARRSGEQARCRPLALAEITLLHTGLAVLARRRGRRWLAASWFLAASHLGMLESRTSLGWPNIVTLVRGNLPVIGGSAGRWITVIALASDLLDGRLARGTAGVTPFGGYADSCADAAFWTWFVLRHEPSRAVRIAALVAWIAPVVAVTTGSVVRGEMVDVPRRVVLRPAAALQAVVTVRAVTRKTGA